MGLPTFVPEMAGMVLARTSAHRRASPSGCAKKTFNAASLLVAGHVPFELARLMCRARPCVNCSIEITSIDRRANDWGGFAADHERTLYPGETYKNLVWGSTCETVTEASIHERVSVIHALSREFSDSRLQAIFNSLSWEDLDRVPIDWFLKGLCARHADRCALTVKLHDKCIKDFQSKFRVDEP
jgi:hypothetical protein